MIYNCTGWLKACTWSQNGNEQPLSQSSPVGVEGVKGYFTCTENASTFNYTEAWQYDIQQLCHYSKGVMSVDSIHLMCYLVSIPVAFSCDVGDFALN